MAFFIDSHGAYGLFPAPLGSVVLAASVSTDLRKTDFTFCAPHTWNKLEHTLEPRTARAVGQISTD